MYYVEKIFRIPIGHRLSKHIGNCFNPHGHNISIEVKIKSEKLNQNDMVIDFSDLKKIVNDHIINPMDHCLILNNNDKTEIKLCDSDREFKIMKINGDPTAENLSKLIFESLEDHFHRDYPELILCSVKIWENEDSAASYSKV